MNEAIHVPIPTDSEGMLGRECPRCERYFKLRPGTGLPIQTCTCPYCTYKGEQTEFVTRAQIEYARSVALKEIQQTVIAPEIRKLGRSFEKASRGSFIKLSAHYRPASIQVSHYEEKNLQTNIVCDGCSLEFAIYGVFATCPDCGRLNALRVFEASLHAVAKRLGLLDASHAAGLEEEILADALDGMVSAFDGVGKEMRRRHPLTFPERPRNLFQNLPALNSVLSTSIGETLSELIGEDKFLFLIRMFNVRHIYNHNMGVIDRDFSSKVPGTSHLVGQKYELRREEVERVLEAIAPLPQRLLMRLSKVDDEGHSPRNDSGP